jgi:predicted DNA-binding antitoxin AbrB/MazE fold protein
MRETITAIYEKGVLRPLVPLSLPEHTQVQIQIVNASAVSTGEEARRQVRQVLLDAGVIQSRPQVEAPLFQSNNWQARWSPSPQQVRSPISSWQTARNGDHVLFRRKRTQSTTKARSRRGLGHLVSSRNTKMTESAPQLQFRSQSLRAEHKDAVHNVQCQIASATTQRTEVANQALL